jgi:hypothetical protein
MPKWNQQSLKTQFDKRVSKDAACMRDVMGRPVTSITEGDYELPGRHKSCLTYLNFASKPSIQEFRYVVLVKHVAVAKHHMHRNVQQLSCCLV